MRNFLRNWLGVNKHGRRLEYVEGRIDYLAHSVKELNDKARKQDENEVVKMNGYSTIGDFTLSFSDNRPFEIVCVTSKKLVRHPGFTTHDEALVYAEKLAAENPGKEFMVYGPFSVSKADIPVVSTEWKADPVDKE